MNFKHYLGLSAIAIPTAGVTGHFVTIRPDYAIKGSLPIDNEGKLTETIPKGKFKGLTIDFKEGKYRIVAFCPGGNGVKNGGTDCTKDNNGIKFRLVKL